MDWSDERWVKLYVRSSVAWQVASFNARGLYYELMRLAGKDSDRVKLGRQGAEGLARLVGLGVTECNAALRELTEGGWVALDGNDAENVFLVGHLEQQKAQTSNKVRQAEFRARQRGNDSANDETVTERNATSRDVTESNEEKRREEKREEEKRKNVARAPGVMKRAVSSAAADLAAYLAEAILSHKPDAKVPDSVTTAVEFDVGLRAGVTVERFKAAIDYAHRDPRGAFWRANVLSAKKLRAKLDTLEIQMAGSANGKPAVRGQGRGLTSEELFAMGGVKL